VIHPCCVVIAEKGSSITIGEGNIIEERSRLLNSSLGMASLIGVAAHVSNSVIGSYCQIGPKCQISNSVIGNCCVIAPMVHLNGVTIPENTSVFPSDSGGGWKMIPLQIDTVVSRPFSSLRFLPHPSVLCSTISSVSGYRRVSASDIITRSAHFYRSPPQASRFVVSGCAEQAGLCHVHCVNKKSHLRHHPLR
jgi:NDP-sugar pyrophosphorylase family protein